MHKRGIALLLAVLMLLMFSVSAAAHGDKILLSAETPCVLIVPSDATIQELYAAQTLQKYLTQITGITVEILSDAVPQTGMEIALGSTNRAASDDSALPNGGYRIFFSGDTLCIRGGGVKGTLNGVYAFLREYCACRWYDPQVTVVPAQTRIALPDDTDYTYTPYFEYAETDWLYGPYDAEYSMANGLNGGNCRTLTPEQGGVVRVMPYLAHTLTTYFCSANTYFDEHPEYFALHDGVRSPNQLCLTNPDTLRIVTQEALDYLAAVHDPDADLQILSVTQHDNGDYCTCPNCKALDDANGSHAGTMVTFANAIADAVRQAGYDNVLIDTFAYQYTRKAPTQVVPADNVAIRLCSIECCFCHPLDDENCKENRAFMDDLRAWNEICKRIYIWDYTTNYWETLCLYPDFGVLQRNLQIFYENHVRGVFEEGNACAVCETEFAALRAYLLSRLMQDPYLDYNAEMQGFLDAYYGAGGTYIYRFLQRTMEKAGASKTAHLGTFPDSTKTLTCFNTQDVAFADEQWTLAREATAGTEAFSRVERSEICWRYWKCNNRKGEFSIWKTSLYDRMHAREALYNDIVRMGVQRTNDTRSRRALTQCRTLILLRRPQKWCELYEESYWDWLEPAVDWLYTTLGKLHRAAD